MTFSSLLPPLLLPFPSGSFPPGGFSKKFPHLLRLWLNGIPQAAFLPRLSVWRKSAGLHSASTQPPRLSFIWPLSLRPALQPSALAFLLSLSTCRPAFRADRRWEGRSRGLAAHVSAAWKQEVESSPVLCGSTLSCAQAAAHLLLLQWRKLTECFGEKRTNTQNAAFVSTQLVRLAAAESLFAGSSASRCTKPLLLQSWCLWCFSGNVSHLKVSDASFSC